MELRRFLCITLLLISFSPDCRSQGPTTVNLEKFDFRPYHFGMSLGYNNSDFFVKRSNNLSFEDSLLTLRNISAPGFNINIVASLKLVKTLSLRFLPGISPKDRVLEYTFLNANGKTSIFTKRVESFYLEFPLFLKYRTERINNFAAYVIGGGKLGLDMASQKNVNNDLSSNEIVIKLVDQDWLASVGGGFDFFLPYFKFGIEFRHEFGLNNQLIQDNTQFSSPLEKLWSKNFILSFTFEG